MTKAQYLFELFKLYKDRQFILSHIAEYGPDHDFFLDVDTTAGEELKKIDQQILDLTRAAFEDEKDIWSDFVYDADQIMIKVLEERAIEVTKAL